MTGRYSRPRRAVTCPHPQVVQRVGIAREEPEYTTVSHHVDSTSAFTQWVKRCIQATLVMLLVVAPVSMAVLVKVAAPPTCVVVPLFTLMVTTPYALAAWESAMVRRLLTRAETEFWAGIESTAAPFYPVARTVSRNRLDIAVTSLLPIVLPAVLAGFFWKDGLVRPAVVLWGAVAVPLAAMQAARYAAVGLPLRFQQKALELENAFFCLLMMISPLMLTGTVLDVRWLGEVAGLRAWFGEVRFFGLVLVGELFLIFLVYAWAREALRASAINTLRLEGRLHGISRAGHEQVLTDPGPRLGYTVSAAIFYSTLAIWTYLGFFVGLAELVVGDLRPGVGQRVAAGLGVADSSGIAATAASLGMLLLFTPMIVGGLAWLAYGGRQLARRVRHCPTRDEGDAFLNEAFRRGLFAEVKAELGVRKLAVRLAAPAAAGGLGFVMSIEPVGLLGRSSVILLDPSFLSVIRSPEERQAALWHEVWHALNARRGGVRKAAWRLFFGFWARQAKAALTDSLSQEVEADLHSARRLGTAAPICSLLTALQKLGGGRVQRRESNPGRLVLDAISRVLLHRAGWRLHPHLEIRLRELRRREQTAG